MGDRTPLTGNSLFRCVWMRLSPIAPQLTHRQPWTPERETLARVHEVLPDYEPLTARTAQSEPIEVTWDRITSPSTEPVDSPGSKWPDLRHGARSTVVCCSTAAIP